MTERALPPRVAELVADFTALPPADRVQLLIELGDELPDPPADLRDHPELLEPVTECQSPLSVRAVVEGAGTDAEVHLYICAAPHAPVTRGFAAVLHTTLDGASPDDVLALPDDVTRRFGLDGLVSPLRLRGFAALLARVRRQVAEAARATAG